MLNRFLQRSFLFLGQSRRIQERVLTKRYVVSPFPLSMFPMLTHLTVYDTREFHR